MSPIRNLSQVNQMNAEHTEDQWLNKQICLLHTRLSVSSNYDNMIWGQNPPRGEVKKMTASFCGGSVWIRSWYLNTKAPFTLVSRRRHEQLGPSLCAEAQTGLIWTRSAVDDTKEIQSYSWHKSVPWSDIYLTPAIDFNLQRDGAILWWIIHKSVSN